MRESYCRLLASLSLELYSSPALLVQELLQNAEDAHRTLNGGPTDDRVRPCLPECLHFHVCLHMCTMPQCPMSNCVRYM